MKRRNFLAILAASAVGWPHAASAQKRTIPVIGFLGPQSPNRELLAKFHQGLNELGYFEGKNVAFEYQWTLSQDRPLAELAADLVKHRVALIVTSGGFASAKAAKDATTTIPILFTSGLDPVQNGFLASFNRPGSNATGLSQSSKELISKRLEILRQLAPGDAKVGYLQNDDTTGLGPNEKAQLESETQIARQLGLVIYFARNETDIEAAFASLTKEKTGALLVASDPFFARQRSQIAGLAARFALPAGYSRREFVEVGGLMSYGPSRTESWRQVGRYAGRILSGVRPEDLPVRLDDKYELVINIKSARALGLAVPPLLHALADDSIE
jgi:putative ABC transport system substrate-binding protein